MAAALALSGTGYAARPFVTDDARIVEPGGYQLETFIKRQHSFGEKEFWFLPAHNPGGPVEFTVGGISIDSTLDRNSRAALAQAKTLFKKLERNGAGYALTLGLTRLHQDTNPYVNGIGSFSLADDRVVLHSNLGARRDSEAGLTRATWGVGSEITLTRRLYGIAEIFGERGEKPTRHVGLRFWVVPDRVQIDSTLGEQVSSPSRRFHSIGLRLFW
jgi:hypothetical protein